MAMMKVSGFLTCERRSYMQSRRSALVMLLGASPCLSEAMFAAETVKGLRLAISESMVADVNLNDARAAMLIWIKKMSRDLNFDVDFNPKVFDSTPEILSRIRKSQLDAVVLNVIEYRQASEWLDSTQVVADGGAAGPEQYIILVKRAGGMSALADLRGRRLIMQKGTRMCVAPAWLSMLLDEGHHGPTEQFFGSVTADSKPSRVVLPVFFGQADAGMTSKRGFDIMSELNPQVAKDLKAIAISPAMVVSFYVFRKNYTGVLRERLIKALSSLRTTTEGRQLATLFQFEELAIKDASCLSTALHILDLADRARNRQGAGGRKG
jgi:ABC-type phosphate/phosphonate transport system substrate-binding protein